MTPLGQLTVAEVVLSLLRITGYAIFGYYLLVNANYLLLHLMALLQLREEVRDDSWDSTYDELQSPFLPGISIVVPAFNEAPVIVESVESLLTVNYPNKEVIVVNDGSTDETLDRLRDAFELRAVNADLPLELPSETVRGVYRSSTRSELIVVDIDALELVFFDVEEYVTLSHLVSGMAGDDLRCRRFAGAVRTHQGVDLAGFDFEIDTTKNRFAAVFGD